ILTTMCSDFQISTIYIMLYNDICIFTLDNHGTKYYPHSFPTRRSSDLFKVGTQPDLPGDAKGLDPAYFTFPKQLTQSVSRTAGEDRKSTRLNSSHLGISYAVFCLKKKTYTDLIEVYNF